MRQAQTSVEAARPQGLRQNLPEIVFLGLVAVLVAVRLVEQHAAFLLAPGTDWNSSEWLIDYAAGFVRRGLGGAVLAGLMRATGLSFFSLWATLTTVVYLAVCWRLVRLCRGLGGSPLWRACLLLNPALLLFPLEARPYGTFLRKEVLFAAATALLAAACQRALRRGQAALPMAVAATVGTALALLHEGMFLFEWLPLNALLLYAVLARSGTRRRALALALMALAPALVAGAASLHWRGTPQAAQTICESWHAYAIATPCTVKETFPPAIDALGWSISYAVSLSVKAAWRFPVYLALLALFMGAALVALRRLQPRARWEDLIVVAVLPQVAALPIFILGWDWGRYSFAVFAQSLWVLLSPELRPLVVDCLPESVRGGLRRVCAAAARVTLEPLGRGMERAPAAVCAVLLLVPLPCVPPERTMLLGSPAAILYDFAHRQADRP